ncbi:GABBR [Acanthosepion pharaonis]|uniref:GABBR n=1 Tax=Acanthosepion pharaonis TaxID=158019 RepID=A0A812ASG7_ACAPH|nr:GABBR [Sepia pharaonis]
MNKKVIKDYKLFLIVGVLLVVDGVMLGTWWGMDPFHIASKELSHSIEGDYEIVPIVESCASEYMTIWMGLIYAYKGLLLVIGCFLAWETRHVSIPALNDSKYIGMSVYNVVIMCTCGAAVSIIIKDQPTSAFIIIGLFIIFSTTITLCLLFVPKVSSRHFQFLHTIFKWFTLVSSWLSIRVT